MKQEIERFGFLGLNLGAIFNEGTDLNLRTVWMSDRPRMVLASRMKASKYGYMGPELKAMFQVRTIVCSRYLRNVALLCASDGNKFYKHCLSNMSLFSNLSPEVTTVCTSTDLVSKIIWTCSIRVQTLVWTQQITDFRLNWVWTFSRKKNNFRTDSVQTRIWN